MDILVDSDSTRPSSPKNNKKRNELECKKSKGLDEDNDERVI